MSEQAIEILVRVLLERVVTEESYTPYQLAVKVVNPVLVQNSNKEIRTQMMYNYARNGMIVPKVQLHGPTLRPITRQEAANFMARYMIRNKLELRTEIQNPDQLELFEI